ncbi:hypothetical protein LQW54_000840 [Pestalotiopsis sp. IQ-011]
MEALAALGLAASIAQFIGMAGKAVAKTRELALSKKNLVEENEELQSIVSDFKAALPMLRAEGGVHDVANAQLKELAAAAETICAEIETKLDSIKARRATKSDKNPLNSLYATWKEMNLKEVFQNLSERLSDLRNQITFHINILLVQQQALVQAALVDTVRTSQDYISMLSRETAELKSHAVIHSIPGDDGEDKFKVKWHGDSDDLFSLGKSLKILKPHFESLTLENWPYVNGEEADKVDRMKRQLIAQFKDLINLYEHPTKGALFNFSVGFIHRTVIEFIGRDNIQEWLYARAGTSFHPATALFEANLEQFKIFSHFWKHPYLHHYLRNWFLASIYYAREIEVTKGISVARQLDQLQEVLDNDPNRAIFRKRSEFVADWWHGSSKTLAISMGLWLYANDTARANECEAALEPELCIELQSDFVVRDVTDTERAERCVIDTTKPSYSSTLHMFTAAEAEHLSRVREKRHKPLLLRQSSSMGYAADEPTIEAQTTRLSFEETRSHRVLYGTLSGSESDARPSNAMSGALTLAAPFEVYETKASRPRKFRNLLKFLE